MPTPVLRNRVDWVDEVYDYHIYIIYYHWLSTVDESSEMSWPLARLQLFGSSPHSTGTCGGWSRSWKVFDLGLRKRSMDTPWNTNHKNHQYLNISINSHDSMTQSSSGITFSLMFDSNLAILRVNYGHVVGILVSSITTWRQMWRLGVLALCASVQVERLSGWISRWNGDLNIKTCGILLCFNGDLIKGDLRWKFIRIFLMGIFILVNATTILLVEDIMGTYWGFHGCMWLGGDLTITQMGTQWRI